ncbi:universal stress protein [Dyella sedimenti]|uniref:universal stress protein n=1 Tax=Dyella sedimenti TaxID=2919947 RepID=UPI001FAA8862|nr:universal stress protein [Dyella sedimenti]
MTAAAPFAPFATGAPTDVLALVTSVSPWSPAARAAVALAARFGARLTGCYVDPSLRMLHGGEAEPSVLALLMDTPGERPEDHEAFLAYARESGVHRASWLATRAGIAPTVRRLGAWHDLAVIERDLAGEDMAFEVLGEALLTCRTSSLILPPAWSGDTRFPRVAVAWNGSIESARAIHAALPFLRASEEVLLLDGEAPVYEDDQVHAPQFDPEAYLGNHGVLFRTRRVRATPRDAGAVLLREIAQARAGLLVMGAYGHSRVRERVLGGATRHILQHAELPIFVQH